MENLVDMLIFINVKRDVPIVQSVDRTNSVLANLTVYV
jgi:hypothetical protein